MTQEHISAALLDRDFERARLLANEWRELVIANVNDASKEAERSAIFNNAISLGEMSLHLARVVRAHIALELQANSALYLYNNPDLERHDWQLHG